MKTESVPIGEATAKLLRSKLSDPEWPRAGRPGSGIMIVDADYFDNWRAAWREAAAKMLMTGAWHCVLRDYTLDDSGWRITPLCKSRHGSNWYFIPS